MSDSTSSSGGIGVTGLLGVLFIGLRLGHVIDWPWIWVLAPFWIGLVALVFIAAIVAFVWGAVLFFRKLR